MAKPRSTPNFDPARQRLGTVYAKALLGASEQAGQTELVLEELGALISDVLNKLPDFDEALQTPRIPPEEKVQLLERVFAARLTPLTLNFLKVVAQHERLDCLRAIERAARLRYNEMRNRVEVLVQSAAPLNNQLRGTIAAKLGKMLGREVVLTTEVNPDLLGGLLVRVGDTVYDGSLAGKLKQMQAVTLEQTTHAIRESLARFSLT
ncbi:MAG: ATP synthase F1 subunit delta [Pirellulaceae bacterium]